MYDMLCVLTTPGELHSIGLAPFVGAPDELVVFCCFFRESEARDAFQRTLRDAAGGTPTAPKDADARTTLLADRFARAWKQGCPDEALEAAIEWRALVSKRGYHTYSLREGFPPYRFGCIVAFDALGPSELRAQFDQACKALAAEQGQVMDVFGWGLSQRE